uniref:RNase H type-1 domain-containing protein n=1 Tax=Oryza brachyantha TaxID=4533 RepID=J3N352_ORYBR
PLAVVQKGARPALGWVKLNTDGALNLQDGVAGAGIVAWDTGNFGTAECRRYTISVIQAQWRCWRVEMQSC